MTRSFSQDDAREMNNATLAKAWEIVTKGRQYEGVEEDRELIGNEMADRLIDKEIDRRYK